MRHSKRLINYLKKALIFLLGTPVVIVGIILIPLPGPGVLITLLGLGIYSLAFDWPKPYINKLQGVLKVIYNKFLEEKKKINQKYK